jgi:hypothetical protein
MFRKGSAGKTIGLRARLRFAPRAATSRSIGFKSEANMRAEVERLVEEIKQSVGLLRRHL